MSPRRLALAGVTLSLLAGFVDWLACSYTMREFQKCGHLHFHFFLIVMGISLSIPAVYAWWLWNIERKERRSPSDPARKADDSSRS